MLETSAARPPAGLVPLTPIDSLRVAGQVLAPLVAQGPIVRRPRVVRLAERLDVDRRATRLVRRLAERYGDGPLLVRLPGRPLALVLAPEHVHRVLAATPRPFTAASREKRAALRHFQPAALLISDDEHRRVRRPFNESVLDTGAPRHGLHDHVAGVVAEEIDRIVAELPVVAGGRRLDWAAFERCHRRVVRRVTLGASARDDEDLTALLTRLRRRANWAFLLPPDTAGLRELAGRLRAYVEEADPTSLAGRVARTPAAHGTATVGQIPHWLFAFEALGIAGFRALALLSAHRVLELAPTGDGSVPDDAGRLARAVLMESVRLWPTTLVLLRDAVEPTVWAGRRAAAGTGFVIYSAYAHRERCRQEWADTFAPGIWLTPEDGSTPPRWEAFVPFSEGPAGCAGQTFVLDVAAAMLVELAARRGVTSAGGTPALDAARPLPRTLDQTRLAFVLGATPPA